MSDAKDVSIWIGKADNSKSIVFWALDHSSIPLPKRLLLVNVHLEHLGLAGHFMVTESHRAQWSYLFQPWLGYVPKFDMFVGPIWGRFSSSRSTLSESISHTCSDQ
ncbi:unnamed protein product [Cyclocybe aegerita]|uniref:Uncharacterized protein n=1 Tax=Cyclocybe aegerita TaxID=1973307 RepID=A0A8S0X2M6_CYCAE|nr:unnamed protein product [Cyclocybe aegerita]